MSDDPERRSLALQELCLGGGWHAGVGVGPGGDCWPWLIHPDDDTPAQHVVPPHEQLGPLPALYRHRLDQHRCGRPRRDGKPCRTPVARSGLTCANHHTHAVSKEAS
jgi:hypothetical protein